MLTPRAMAPMYIASTPRSIHFRLFTDWWPMMAIPITSRRTGRKRRSCRQSIRDALAEAAGASAAGGAITADSSVTAFLVRTSDLLNHGRAEDALGPKDQHHQEEGEDGEQFVATARW